MSLFKKKPKAPPPPTKEEIVYKTLIDRSYTAEPGNTTMAKYGWKRCSIRVVQDDGSLARLYLTFTPDSLIVSNDETISVADLHQVTFYKWRYPEEFEALSRAYDYDGGGFEHAKDWWEKLAPTNPLDNQPTNT